MGFIRPEWDKLTISIKLLVVFPNPHVVQVIIYTTALNSDSRFSRNPPLCFSHPFDHMWRLKKGKYQMKIWILRSQLWASRAPRVCVYNTSLSHYFQTRVSTVKIKQKKKSLHPIVGVLFFSPLRTVTSNLWKYPPLYRAAFAMCIRECKYAQFPFPLSLLLFSLHFFNSFNANLL